MWATIFSFALGFGGWLFAKFIFEPYKEVYDLRREAAEALIIHGDLVPNAASEERHEAARAFQRIGAGLVARHFARHFAQSLPDWVYIWPSLGWDIHSAGQFLLGLAQATEKGGFSNANISPPVMTIRSALKLPTPTRSSIEEAMIQNMTAGDGGGFGA